MPPRGKHNNHNNHRSRGRGRGGPHRPGPANAPTGTSRGPHRPYPHSNTEIDVVVQQWAEPDTAMGGNATGNVNRRDGPWHRGTPKSRSGSGTPLRGMDSPRRGSSTPRGWGRGRGRGRGRGLEPDNGTPSRRPRFGVGGATKAKPLLGKDAPLSELLFSDRPLLRPVKFVRATLTPFLFQDSEEVLKSAGDINVDTTETSHVPTANRVAQLFHNNVLDSDSESDDRVEDALEEIDFADMAQMRAEVDAIAQSTTTIALDIHDAQGDIEEVDFADLAAIRAQVDAAEPQAISQGDTLEEVFTGVYNHVKEGPDIIDDAKSISCTPDESPVLKPSTEISNQTNHESLSNAIIIEEVPYPSNELLDVPAVGLSEYITPEAESVPILSNDLSPPPEHVPHPLFVIDTTPMLPLPHRSASEVILVDRTGHGETLGEDEEQIVYVAPHPRSGRLSPAHSPVRPSNTSMPTGGLTSSIHEDNDVVPANAEREQDFLSLAALTLDSPQDAVAAGRARKKEARMQRKRQRQSKRGRMGFGALGAIVSEAQLREEDAAEKRRPRWATRRRGDSDLDWGSEDQEQAEDEVDALSDGLGGMTIDPDLEVDGFLKSMSVDGSRFVTMDDIEDEARLRQEDEEGGPTGSSDSELSADEAVEDDEEEAVFNVEEKILIAESDDDALSPDSDDDDLSPRSSFQARLQKAREMSAPPKAVAETSDDEEEGVPRTHAADDEEFLAYFGDILDKNSEILSSRDRKQKKAVFRNLHEGYVDDPYFTTPVQAKKGKGKEFTGPLASVLQVQYAKDRAKKAAQKRERATARLVAALDPVNSRGASRKAMRAAARLEPGKAQSVTPHAIVDADALEAQIRRFVGEKRMSVALPPMDKAARKVVHELAVVFGLNSVSKGKGYKRYTTLFRTHRTGVGVREDKVRAVMRRFGGGKSGGGRGRMPRHKEGEEVGKEAPKIGEGNIGFRMLASMGWSEGARIGGSSSVGIEAPLTAVIKHSKLGLGATR